VLDREDQAGRRRGVVVGVAVVAAHQPPVDLGEGVEVDRRRELAAHQVRLGLDVEPGEDEGRPVAEAAERGDATLQVRRGRLATTPLMRTRSGPSSDSVIVSKRAVTSGLA
jgi:hypothetical protein